MLSARTNNSEKTLKSPAVAAKLQAFAQVSAHIFKRGSAHANLQTYAQERPTWIFADLWTERV